MWFLKYFYSLKITLQRKHSWPPNMRHNSLYNFIYMIVGSCRCSPVVYRTFFTYVYCHASRFPDTLCYIVESAHQCLRKSNSSNRVKQIISVNIQVIHWIQILKPIHLNSPPISIQCKVLHDAYLPLYFLHPVG